MKGSKESCLLGQKHNKRNFGVIPFINLQNKTKTKNSRVSLYPKCKYNRMFGVILLWHASATVINNTLESIVHVT